MTEYEHAMIKLECLKEARLAASEWENTGDIAIKIYQAIVNGNWDPLPNIPPKAEAADA